MIFFIYVISSNGLLVRNFSEFLIDLDFLPQNVYISRLSDQCWQILVKREITKFAKNANIGDTYPIFFSLLKFATVNRKT